MKSVKVISSDTLQGVVVISSATPYTNPYIKDICQGQNKISAVEPYPKVTPAPSTTPPSLYPSNINPYTHIYISYITYTHIDIVSYACVSLVFVVLMY